MALATNKKNKIIADWKAGRFKSFYAVAKHYKISEPTAKNILADISQSNADIVDVGVAYEKAKKLSKNLVEAKAIERLVAERTIADEIEECSLSGTLLNIKSVKKKIEAEEVKTMHEHRRAQETFDKAMITSGKAARFAPKQDINLTNAQQNNDNQIEVVFK